MHRIMITYPLFGEGMEILKTQTELFMSNSGDLEPYLPQLRQAEAFITRNVHPTTAMLETCPELKIIGIPGVGYQSYDMDYLNRRGIAIVYCPGTNLRSVAEHAVAMAYAAAKHIVEDNNACKAGNYAIRNRFNHRELFGCTVGIAGFGHIGRETARLFRLHDCQICVYDPFAKAEEVQALGYRLCATVEELMAASDIVSLHMPSLPSTKGMFGKAQFAAAKPGSFLINCARGSVVDEQALYEALTAGPLAGAALDVMADEPFRIDNPLLSLDNVIVTPHVAGVTREAANLAHKLVVTSTLQLLDGIRIPNVANPQALEHPRWTLK